MAKEWLRDWYADSFLILFQVGALVLFLAIFIGALMMVYRRGGKAYYDHKAQLIFADGTPTAAQPPKAGPTDGNPA